MLVSIGDKPCEKLLPHDLETLLQLFAVVFEVPKGLPQRRSCDH